MQVFAAMADVLARGDGPSHHDLPGGLRGVLGRNDRVDVFGNRSAGHDPDCRSGREFPRERLAGHGLAQDAKLEGVVFGRSGRFRAAQRKAVHRGPIEAGDVERCNHVRRQCAAAGLLEPN